MRRGGLTTDRRTLVAMAIAGNVVPVAIATASHWSSHRFVFFAGALGVCVVPLLVTGLPARCRRARRLASFAGIPALTLMQAYTGGAASGYSVLMMMAMVWFGLQADDRDVLVMIGLLAACSYLPMLLFGPPAYPISWGNATLLVLIGTTVAGVLRKMTRRIVRLTDRLRQEAVIDPLTSLLNRRGWEQAAPAELERADRTDATVSLVAFDLDDFKHLNDTYGHDEGDRVLRETADRARGALRAGDILARLGGDEFVALLVASTPAGAVAALERMRADTPRRAAFSAGIATKAQGETLEDLARRADLALYAAKAAGGDRVEVAGRPLEEGKRGLTLPNGVW